MSVFGSDVSGALLFLTFSHSVAKYVRCVVEYRYGLSELF